MKNDTNFLYEIGMLRHIKRQWHRFGGVNYADLADHHMHVMWIALVLAKHEKVTTTEKIMKMAMVHDIAESRTNDVDYLSRQYVSRNEELGLSDMLADTVLEKEFIELYKEYEARQSIESKIVKDADNLDIDFEIQEQAANGVHIKGWDEHRQHVADNFLYTKSAKKLRASIINTDPHAWHVDSKRNRLKGGDWQKGKK